MDVEKQTDQNPDNNFEHLLPVAFDTFVSEHPSAKDIIYQAIATDRARRQVQQNPARYDTPYDEWPARRNLPYYIGGGLEKAAYNYEKDYVVKVLNRREGDQGNEQFATPFNKQVDSLLIGRGVAGLEQIVTADPNEGVIITKHVPGVSILRIPSANLVGRIKKEHITKLDETLRFMREHLLTYENVANVFFDPKEGFSIIDYQSYRQEEAGDDQSVPVYRQAQEGHQVKPFLNYVLSLKTKELKGSFDEHGNTETLLKKSLGGKFIAAMTPKLKMK